jgi:hypothetical protein
MTTFVRCVAGLVRLDHIKAVRDSEEGAEALLNDGSVVRLTTEKSPLDSALRTALVEIGLSGQDGPVRDGPCRGTT